MKKHAKNPHLRALITISGLAVCALLATLIIAGFAKLGFINPALAWISLIFSIGFGLIDLTIWLLGHLQMRRARDFLSSERPLVRWVYTAAEWQQLKENIWQEESGDWKLQWGCLTILLALAGFLTGAMLGIENGILEIALSAFLGLGGGALVGGLIGALVAGGNLWGARLAYQDSQPGQVALGPIEIYINGDYFKGDGVNRHIQGAKIHPGNPATLEFQLVFPPRPRMPREEIWSIPISEKFEESVDKNLSAIIGSKT